MLPGSTLFCTSAFSNSSTDSPMSAILAASGFSSTCRSSTPVTSTIATWGNCSMRRLMTFPASSHSSRKASSVSTASVGLAPFSVRQR